MLILAVCLAASVAAMPAIPHDPASVLHQEYVDPSDKFHRNMFEIPRAPELPPHDPLNQAALKREAEDMKINEDEFLQEAKPEHFEEEKLEEPTPENIEEPEENHEIPEKFEEKPESPVAPIAPEKPLAPIEVKPEVHEFAPVIIPLEQQKPHFWTSWVRWPSFSLPFSLPSVSSLSNLASYLPIKLPNIQSLPSSIPSLSSLSNIPSSLASSVPSLSSLSSMSPISSLPSLSSLSSVSPISSLPSVSKPFFMRNYVVLPNRLEDEQQQKAYVYSYVYK